jgi:hypothetical protein
MAGVEQMDFGIRQNATMDGSVCDPAHIPGNPSRP